MMRRVYGRLAFALLVVALALTLVQVRQAKAQGVGSAGQVTGHVVNGTADGSAPGAGLPVRLRVARGVTDQEVIETAAAADGVSFEGLDTDPGLEYWPEAVYLGVYPCRARSLSAVRPAGCDAYGL
jgi:hypothetical protein